MSASTLQWEPLIWCCARDLERDRVWEEVFAGSERDCAGYEREAGSDDDAGERSPYRPDAENAVTGTTDALQRISEGGQ
jgi:hypothetical protein